MKFLTLNRNAIINSPPIRDNWIELNGAWLSRFSQASKELDPTFDFEDKADNTVSMFDLVEVLLDSVLWEVLPSPHYLRHGLFCFG
jgi:hypothetical protein